jgi:ribosome production factor 2
MGDKIGRVHVDRQDLSTLQTRKFKGLKKRKGEDGGDDAGAESEGEKPLSGGGGEGRKRTKV